MTWTTAEAEEKIEELKHWIRTFIVREFPELDNLPVCPYAPPALKNNTIRIKIVQDDLATALKGFADNWTDSDDDGKIEVLAVLTPTERYTGKEFEAIAEEVNDHIMPSNLVVLDDHPNNLEQVGELIFNFGKSALVLMARLDVLNGGSIQLAKNTNYYKHWPKDYLEWVTLWRFKKVPEAFKKYVD
jgi:hypothetical protein|tara:strand:+ start:45 stop:605 length:561 start_codon:yes stop_codon:yes gene_type:complete